jgi:hypothetical protein
MYTVWIGKRDNNGQIEPFTQVPQSHEHLQDALLSAGRMVRGLCGGTELRATNATVLGVHPPDCIVIDAPTDRSICALVPGASLTDDEGRVAPGATTTGHMNVAIA